MVAEFPPRPFVSGLGLGPLGIFAVQTRRQEIIQDFFLGVSGGFVIPEPGLLVPLHLHRAFDEIANHALDVSADIADFGKLSGLDLYEGRAHQRGQPAGDFRFAHTGGSDHYDVFGGYFFTNLRGNLLAPPAVTNGDRHSPLGLILAYDELVEFGYDLARGQVLLFLLRQCHFQINPFLWLRFGLAAM